MSFCVNCGESLSDSTKFCSKCGTQVDLNYEITNSERKIVYDGEIHKCPRCGEILNHRDLICPTCKYELRDIKESRIMQELNEKLDRAKTEMEQIVIIRSFPIPKTKEGLSELSKWAASNFDADFSASHQTVDDISDAYYSMLKKCYLQALDLLDNQSQEFISIKNIFDSVEQEKNKKQNEFLNREKKRNKKTFRIQDYFPLICILAILLVIISVVIIFFNFFGVMNLNKSKTAVGIPSKNLVEMDYMAVEDLLQEKGFTKVNIKQLEWNSEYSSNEIIYITIDGKKDFSRFKKFLKESSIIIYINGTPQKISVGYNQEDIIGQKFQDITEKLKARSFKIIKYNTLEWYPNEESQIVKNITIDGLSDFNSDTEFAQDSIVTIYYNLPPQLVEIGYDAYDLSKLTSTEICSILESKGFAYIDIEKTDWEYYYDIGETRYITFNGERDFEKNSKFSQDSVIVIYLNGTPRSISVGYNYDDLLGKKYEDVVELLEQRGFKNIETIEDGWNLFHKADTVKNITINGESKFTKDLVYLQDAIIKIYYYE